MRQQTDLKVAARPSRRGRKPAKAKIYPAQSLRDAAYDALPKAIRAELHERFACRECHQRLVDEALSHIGDYE